MGIPRSLRAAARANRPGAAASSRCAILVTVLSRRVSAIVTPPYDHTIGSSWSYSRAEHNRPGIRTV